MVAMAVMFLNVKRRGGSTMRIATAASAWLGAAVTATVEAVARQRWGRWLADHPAAPASRGT